MKIKLENGERLVVEVPSSFPTSTMVAIEDDRGHSLYSVQTIDGLIGAVQRNVTYRYAPEDPMRLWAHLVSQHATIVPVQATLEELIGMHEHEHDGPGTIRNHPRESREYSLKKIGKVLSESEE